MNFSDALGFSYRLVITDFELASWVWAASATLLAIVVIGLFWGLLWNRKWGIFNQLSWALLSLVIGLLLGASVLAWSGADRTALWLEAERETLTRQLISDGRVNREAFRDAWDKLEPRGGQKDLTAPADGGNEIRLASKDDAKILALAAASAAKRPLLVEGPFLLGAPLITRDPAAVAEEVVAALPAASYPVIVSPSNEWSKAAVARQVAVAIEAATKSLSPPLKELKTALTVFGALLLLIHLVLIPIGAVSDIKENPRV